MSKIFHLGSLYFQAFETWSMGSVGGRSRSSSERRTIRSSPRSGGTSTPVRAGTILRHAILKAISSQVSSASVSPFKPISSCASQMYDQTCRIDDSKIMINEPSNVKFTA